MPAASRLDADCVLISLWDEVTDAEMLLCMEELWARTDHRPDAPRLVDATRVTRAAVTAEGVRYVAYTWGTRVKGRTALLASTEGVYGMLRMYELYANDSNCRAFRQRDDAFDWLEVEPR